MEDIQIIEVGGTKIEIDFSRARKIETFKVGDCIKIFKKKYSDWKLYPAIITGFASSDEMSGIEVTYLETEYNSATMKCEVVTAETKETIIASISSNENYMSFNTLTELLARDIDKKEMELAEAKSKLKFFKDFYGKYEQTQKEK